MNNITFTPGEVSSYCGVRAPHLKQEHGPEWRGWCIIHKGKNANFTLDSATDRWFCHSACGRGGDIIDLEMRSRGQISRRRKPRTSGSWAGSNLSAGTLAHTVIRNRQQQQAAGARLSATTPVQISF